MSKKKSNKRIKSININNDVWDKIDNYIDCSKSEWIEKQMIKQIYCNDDETKLIKKIEALESEINNLEYEKQIVMDSLKELQKVKENNRNNQNLILKAMSTIRTVNNNEDCIEKNRVEFIANTYNIPSEVLFDEIRIDSRIKLIEK